MPILQRVEEIPDDNDARLVTDAKADYISQALSKNLNFKPDVVDALLYTRQRLMFHIEQMIALDSLSNHEDAMRLVKQLKGELV